MAERDVFPVPAGIDLERAYRGGPFAGLRFPRAAARAGSARARSAAKTGGLALADPPSRPDFRAERGAEEGGDWREKVRI